jgi:hypothetical protein
MMEHGHHEDDEHTGEPRGQIGPLVQIVGHESRQPAEQSFVAAPNGRPMLLGSACAVLFRACQHPYARASDDVIPQADHPDHQPVRVVSLDRVVIALVARVSLKTHVYGYGKLDHGNGGGKPVFSGG